jgi:gliding motility-associated-like protein
VKNIKTSLTTALLLFAFVSNAQLVINELSQGLNSKEYVEFLVTGTPSCTDSCVDLRNWIIDDNNGWHAAGSGVGIAAGCMKFKNTSIWECIKIGTLIVVYNSNDRNPLLPADDLSTSDGNCRLIIPFDDASFFDYDPVTPNNNDDSYANFTPTAAGLWGSMMGMRNDGDAFHTVSPTDITVPHHSVAWGNNGNSDIYFSGSASGLSYFMSNAVSNDIYDQANWSSGAVGSAAETPGAPNNAANATWINSLNNNCQPFAGVVTAITGNTTICNGVSTTLTASGGSSYQWSTGAVTASINVTPQTNTKYKVTVTQGNCVAEDSVTVIVNALPNVSAGNDITICTGDVVTLTATGAQQYLWSNAATTASITVTPIATTSYIVTGTGANLCSKSDTVTVTVGNTLQAQVNGDTTICEGESTQLTAVGGSIFNWSNGATTAAITVNPLLNTTYTVTVSSSTGCADTVTVTVSVNPFPTANAGANETICAGISTTLTATGGSQYNWSTGDNQNTITVQPVATTTYYVTVTNSAGCSDSASVTITVQQLQLNVNYVTADESCTAAADGSVTVSVSPSGNYNFSFLLNNTEVANNSTGIVSNLSAGNYTVAIEDIATGCIQNGGFIIALAQEPAFTATTIAPSCFIGLQNDGSITVNGGNNNFQYSIDNSNFQPSNIFNGLTPANYTVYITDGICTFTLNTNIAQAVPETLTVPESIELIKGSSADIAITLSNTNYTISIEPSTGLSCNDCTTPVVSGIEVNTTYVVTASSGNCVLTDTFTVVVVEKELIIFPTAFTPNGDNLNDFFRPSYSGTINDYVLRVFNRWGEKVFESNALTLGWDGTYKNEIQPLETYTWYCTYKDFKATEKLLKGNFNLIR